VADTCTRIFVDTETTDLPVGKGEIIDVAILVEEVGAPFTSPGVIVSSWSQKVLPEHIETAHPDALRVNGYTPEAWADAVPFTEVIPKLMGLFDTKGVWIGHNPKFDRDHIVAGLLAHGIDVEKPERHRIIDTTVIAYVAWGLDGRFSVSMNNIRKHLGIPKDGAHGALKDAYDAREVFYRGLRGIASTLWAAGFGIA
jgi:DNA polymerase III epsilon subunit-like protein